METVSAIASITAIIQISEQVVKICSQLCSSVKDVKKDIIEVITVVGGLKFMLDSLFALLDTNNSSGEPRLPLLKCVDGSIRACKSAVHPLAT